MKFIKSETGTIINFDKIESMTMIKKGNYAEIIAYAPAYSESGEEKYILFSHKDVTQVEDAYNYISTAMQYEDIVIGLDFGKYEFMKPENMTVLKKKWSF